MALWQIGTAYGARVVCAFEKECFKCATVLSVTRKQFPYPRRSPYGRRARKYSSHPALPKAVEVFMCSNSRGRSINHHKRRVELKFQPVLHSFRQHELIAARPPWRGGHRAIARTGDDTGSSAMARHETEGSQYRRSS